MKEPLQQRTNRWRTYLKWGGWMVASLALLLVVAQITFPFWFAKLSPLIAKRLDLEQVSFVASRPGWRGIKLEQLVAVSDAFRVEAQGLYVTYSWSGLRRLGLDRVDADLLDIAVYSPRSEPVREPVKPPLISDLPLDALAVRSLILRFPDTGFVGRGSVSLGDEGLRLTMDGEAPEAASAMRVAARLTRVGEFDVRVGERDRPDAHFLTLTGRLLDDSMTVRGAVDLTGFPLRLASDILGVPQGSGRAAGEFATRLPWPLPGELDWNSLVIHVNEMSLDWAADDAALEVRQLVGEAVMDLGTLRASLGGDLSYVAGERRLSARLAPQSPLFFDDKTLRGKSGLSITGVWDATQVLAEVSSFSLRAEAERQLKLTTRLTLRQGSKTDSGDFDIDVSLLPPVDVGGIAEQAFTIGARLSTPSPSREFARLAGAWTGDSITAHGRVDLSGDTLSLVSSVAGLPAGDGALSAEFHGALSNVTSNLPAAVALTVSSLAFDWESADKALVVTGIRGNVESNGAAFDAALRGAVKLRLDDRVVNVRLPPDYRLRWSNDVLRGGAGVTLNSEQDDQNISATVRNFALRAGSRARLDLDVDIDARVDASRASGRVHGQVMQSAARENSAQGRLVFEGDVAAAGQKREGKLESEFTLRQAALAANGSLTTAGIGRVPFALTYNMTTQAGTLEVDKSFEFFEPAARLFIPDWSAAYDLDSGKVGVSLVAQLVNALPAAAVVKLTIEEGAAHYTDYSFAGINGQLQLTTTDVTGNAPWRVLPAELQISNIDLGLPLTDATVGIELDDKLLRVTRAEAALLGGRVSTTPFDMNIELGNAVFDVTLEGLDLAQVMALEGDDISGTGRLDGDLPITLENFVATVAKGRVGARPPGGIIKVSPRLAETGGQAELSFALRALSDLRYNKLDATVDYAANGDLDLGVTLQGRNPLVEKDRPIHYNLNISENIPVLLESLRLQDRLSEDIEKRLSR